MRIGNVIHKGLRRFIERDDRSGLPPAAVEKLRNMVSFIENMGAPEELRSLKSWKAHQLTGDRKGTWSLTVTRNWRLTFLIYKKEVVDLDLEDYH